MKVLAYDLNTHHTGVLGAVIDDDDGKILSIMSATIQVIDFKVRDHFPYRESKKKLPTSPNGQKTHSTYFLPGETHVSQTNKRKRDAEVRQFRNTYQRDHMSKQYAALMKKVNPDFVLLERNEIFNGLLTIEVLAKLTGTLIGQCNAMGIPYEEHNVNTVRKPYDVAKMGMTFSKGKSPEYLAGLEDVTKAAIGDFLEKKYKSFGLRFDTLDESDAALVFDYWYTHWYKHRRQQHG